MAKSQNMPQGLEFWDGHVHAPQPHGNLDEDLAHTHQSSESSSTTSDGDDDLDDDDLPPPNALNADNVHAPGGQHPHHRQDVLSPGVGLPNTGVVLDHLTNQKSSEETSSGKPTSDKSSHHEQ